MRILRLYAGIIVKNMPVKRFIPVISDALLAALCTFMLAFTFVRYHFGGAYGLAAAIPSAAAAGTLAFLYANGKRKKTSDAAALSGETEKLAAHLALLEPQKAAELFAKCLDGAEVTGNEVTTDEGVYVCDFAPEPADRNALMAAARLKTEGKKHFACCSATPGCERFAEAAGIELICAGEIYERLKERDALPEKYLLESAGRSGIFARIKKGFSRRLCLPAFWSGTAMLFFSYFAFYPVYYIVAGSLLLALCAAAAIFGKRAK